MENPEEVDDDEEDDRGEIQVEVGREKPKRNREDERSGAPPKKARK